MLHERRYYKENNTSANVVPSSPILVTLTIEETRSSEE
jgi:hypothetical protein